MEAQDLKAAAVLLAAGMSRRTGARNKLLIEIGGEPLVRRTAKAYLAAGAHVHAVLGHDAGKVRAALAGLPLSFVTNPSYAEGQPGSVKAGVESLAQGYDAILIALADQPALAAADIASLLDAFAGCGGGRVFIPYFEEQRGNPVVFPGRLIAERLAAGEFAAPRTFLDRNTHLVERYEAGHNRFAIDIDTPEDLSAFT